MNSKGAKASKSAKHTYLRKHYGRPTYCINEECDGKSKMFDWCKKTGHKYTHNPTDYIWLCRSCHRRYDLTPRKKTLAIKNLWWEKGFKNPGLLFKKGIVPGTSFKKGHKFHGNRHTKLGGSVRQRVWTRQKLQNRIIQLCGRLRLQEK